MHLTDVQPYVYIIYFGISTFNSFLNKFYTLFKRCINSQYCIRCVVYLSTNNVMSSVNTNLKIVLMYTFTKYIVVILITCIFMGFIYPQALKVYYRLNSIPICYLYSKQLRYLSDFQDCLVLSMTFNFSNPFLCLVSDRGNFVGLFVVIKYICTNFNTFN